MRTDQSRIIPNLFIFWTGAVALSLLVGGVGGCSAGERFRVQSETTGEVFAPLLPYAVYRHDGNRSLEVFLTDIEPALLDPRLDPPATGVLVQLHMFLAPRPGRTPMETTSTNATVRMVVVAPGGVGVYEGGGFLRPRGRAGEPTVDVSMQGGTIRPTGWSGSFRDRLGASRFDVRVRARKDAAMAGAVAAFMDAMASRVVQAGATQSPSSADAAPE